MIDPVRPQDASGVYRRQVANTPPPAHERGRGPERAGHGRRSDQIDLSERARELRSAVAAVANQPELRAELVAALRQQIDDGTYRVDARAIARALLAEGSDA